MYVRSEPQNKTVWTPELNDCSCHKRELCIFSQWARGRHPLHVPAGGQRGCRDGTTRHHPGAGFARDGGHDCRGSCGGVGPTELRRRCPGVRWCQPCGNRRILLAELAPGAPDRVAVGAPPGPRPWRRPARRRLPHAVEGDAGPKWRGGGHARCRAEAG